MDVYGELNEARKSVVRAEQMLAGNADATDEQMQSVADAFTMIVAAMIRNAR